LTLVGASRAGAQDQWLKDGKPAPQDPAMASSPQGFAVRQVATLEGEAFVRRWNEPTPGVTVDTSSRVGRNQPIFTFIVFTGCKADAAGKCNVSADFKMTDPNGKPWGEQKGMPVWVGIAAPAHGILQLSTAYLGLVVENKDPLGAYRVAADVIDHVANISLHTEQTIVASADKVSAR
jgi:hypothetical protein